MSERSLSRLDRIEAILEQTMAGLNRLEANQEVAQTNHEALQTIVQSNSAAIGTRRSSTVECFIASLTSILSIQLEKQQLQQRVEELEKALEDSKNSSWSNTFSTQAAKLVNSELEQTIAPLISEVERLETVVEAQKVEIEQLQSINRQQQEEITTFQQSELSNEIEDVVSDFGAMGETLGWNGWNRNGYRSVDGMLYRGISAIANFVCDLKQESRFEMAMNN